MSERSEQKQQVQKGEHERQELTSVSTNAGGSSSPPSPSPSLSSLSSWKLEESSLFWWTKLEMWKNPGNVLLIASIPFCAGAYFGYRKPAERLEEQFVGTASETSAAAEAEFGTSSERRALGVRTAARALRLATLGTFGICGFVGAVAFYASGFQTLDEAIDYTRAWAYTKREGFEQWLGMEDRPSKTHPEVVATKHMSEEEEMDYLYDKYIKEPEDESASSSTTQQPDSGSNNQ